MQIPDPAHNPVLIGHDEAIRQIGEAFASGRMHHAWLIAGIEGIGKATLAYHIANFVLSGGQNPPGKLDLNHPAGKLIRAEAHPDMLVVRRTPNEKGEMRNVIVVEDALKIAAFLHKTATHSGWRVVIVDEAHVLNRFGQNAILKILEEPPARTLIVITTTAPGALLPTIRSRCRLLPLAPLDDAHMKTILARMQPDLPEEDVKRLIALAGGSIGFALKIVRTETLPLYEELLGLLGAMPELDIARLHKLADQIGRKADAESFEVITALLVDHLRQLVRSQALAGQKELDRPLQLWDKTRATFALADSANLDHKLAFINAISDIRRAIA